MKRNLMPILLCASLILVAALVRYGAARESMQSNDGSPSQVLITEIQELRRALQESTTRTFRVQVSIERWRVQQSIVDRLTQERYTVQDQLDGAASTLRQLEQAARQLQELASSEPNPTQRAQLAREYQTALLNVEESKQVILRLQQRESEINANFEAEKAKAQELKNSLDALDPSIKQAADKKR